MYQLASHRMGPRAWDLVSNHDLCIQILVLIFVVGHVIGMALLAFALWRSRAVPTWVAGTLLLSDVGHFISHLAQSCPLYIISFGLFVVAGAASARIVLGTTDDSWDRPPVPAEIGAAARHGSPSRIAADAVG
jgi:hypothetical protein